MSKTGAEMRFRATGDNLVKMLMKDVCINSKQPSHDSFHNRAIVIRKLVILDGRKQLLIRELSIDPVHEQADILGGGDLDRRLMPVIIGPQILILRTRAHDGARLGGALIAHGAVDEVDLVEQVDDVDADPIVDVVAIRDLDGLSQVTGIQRRLQHLVRKLVDLVPRIRGLRFSARLEGLVAVEDGEHVVPWNGFAGVCGASGLPGFLSRRWWWWEAGRCSSSFEAMFAVGEGATWKVR